MFTSTLNIYDMGPDAESCVSNYSCRMLKQIYSIITVNAIKLTTPLSSGRTDVRQAGIRNIKSGTLSF